ncbi:hypothetical protein A7A52_13125 [Acinetobacter baumannii]|nr:hypothetical protein A7A52_13125 [Acinetobacter baumannii]
MPAFEWVHVQLHQQKGMISLSPPTICNSALNRIDHESTIFSHCLQGSEFKEALSAFKEKRKPNFHKQTA